MSDNDVVTIKKGIVTINNGIVTAQTAIVVNGFGRNAIVTIRISV